MKQINMAYYGDKKREYQREWMRKRRQEWIDSQGGKCIDCESTEKLDVDHADAKTKLLPPTKLWSRRKEFREKELIKCVVRCNPCHKIKSKLNHEAAHGEDQGLSLFTNEIARQIRAEYATGQFSQIELAKKYQVSKQTMSDLLRRKTYKWI